MFDKSKSILLVGFNTRPLAASLKTAGYEVYVVDFFGDIDLYPNVKDSVILTKELGTNYHLLKENFKEYLIDYAIEMLKKYPKIDYLLIGSGLDDSFKERELLLNEIKRNEYEIIDLNNDLDTIKKARDIESIYKYLNSKGYVIPLTESFVQEISPDLLLNPPYIFKKKNSSGGINVYKIKNHAVYSFLIKKLNIEGFNPSEWILQEFIEGIPVSCTTISNGIEAEVISINRQIIGEDFLNSPKKFIYCGNIVPSTLLPELEAKIAEISIKLTNYLELKGINGFDYVMKNNEPYLMEINPRIPGSISVSEEVLDLNLLDLHVKSFNPMKWNDIKKMIKNLKLDGFATKFIFFAPEEIKPDKIKKINNLNHIYDKTEPLKQVLKGEPLCSILFKDKNFKTSYFGALLIVDAIERIIHEH